MGVSARAVKCAAAVVFLAAARARVRKWRRDDLIVNGYFRAVEAVLTALVSRAVSLPLLRMARWICRVLVLPLLGRMPMRLAEPLFLHQLQDSAGRHFLTRALRDARVIRQTGFVRRVTVEPFTAGQLSVTARVGLTYGDTEAETKRTAKGSHLGPPSLIIKMTRQDLIGKTVNMLVGLYRECHVYRDLLPLTDLPVPNCYWLSDRLTFCAAL